MKEALFICDVECPVGEKKLFRCNPPMKDFNGNKHEFVVVSAVNHSFAHETFFFPSNEEGKITDWLEMPGSIGGINDHNQALINAGYSPIKQVTESEPVKLLMK